MSETFGFALKFPRHLTRQPDRPEAGKQERGKENHPNFTKVSNMIFAIKKKGRRTKLGINDSFF